MELRIVGDERAPQKSALPLEVTLFPLKITFFISGLEKLYNIIPPAPLVAELFTTVRIQLLFMQVVVVQKTA